LGRPSKMKLLREKPRKLFTSGTGSFHWCGTLVPLAVAEPHASFQESLVSV